jgi:hypothetical protein
MNEAVFWQIIEEAKATAGEEDAPDFTPEQRTKIIKAEGWHVNNERLAEFYLAKYPRLAIHFKEKRRVL